MGKKIKKETVADFELDIDIDDKDEVYQKLIENNSDMIEKEEDGSILIKDEFWQPVEDVWRYCIKNGKLIKFKKNSKKFNSSTFQDKKIDLENKSKIKTIVLILESPHQYEYKIINKIFTPIAPAQGKTGINIKKDIINILMEIEKNTSFSLKNESYRLILSNPVPYQASLYHLHNTINSDLKDKVWRKILNDKNIQGKFKDKLVAYNPDLIINACTSKLSCRIRTFCKKYKLKINNNKFIYTKTCHPSSWSDYGLTIQKKGVL